jgi:site-specific DNA-adenine methylase
LKKISPSSKIKGAFPRPFFGYYGGKWRDALKHYPAPRFNTIVEPFAGSAGYALRYHHAKRVFLFEKDPVVAGVWDYLINKATTNDILTLPNVPLRGSVEKLEVCAEAKALIGFWLNRGVSMPRKKPSRWMRDEIRPGSFWGERVRHTIASQLHLIKRWKIYNCDYTEAPTILAKELPDEDEFTWFIDPPYQKAGHHYRYGANGINYGELAKWCKSRPGQVIVCENKGAKWLRFKSIADVKTTRKKRSKETLWLKDKKPKKKFGQPTSPQRQLTMSI